MNSSNAVPDSEKERQYLPKNPSTLAKAPRLEETEVDPFTVEEVQRLLLTGAARRNSTRWAITLVLGQRQGEALGLKWEDIHLDVGAMRIKRVRHGRSGRTVARAIADESSVVTARAGAPSS